MILPVGVIFLLFQSVAASKAENLFKSRWTTTGYDEMISLPITDDFDFEHSFFVNWGDNSEVSHITSSAMAHHTYLGEGRDYWINISGPVEGFAFGGMRSSTKIQEVSSWGEFTISPLRKEPIAPCVGAGCNRFSVGYFDGCSNMDITATDAPIITPGVSLELMFRYCSSLSDINFNHWDVSKVVSMDGMFAGSSFKGQTYGLNSWVVSSVRSMYFMFYRSAFIGDVSDWSVGSVTDMRSMFGYTNFGGSLSKWDTSSVTTMDDMFIQNTAFDGDLSAWVVTSVVTMANMFEGTVVFTGIGLSQWDVSNVEDMSDMFRITEAFNADIGGWNTASAIYMPEMFHGSEVFNQDISEWNVESVEEMDRMFYHSQAFSQDLSNWNATSVEDCVDFAPSLEVEFPTGPCFPGPQLACDQACQIYGRGMDIDDYNQSTAQNISEWGDDWNLLVESSVCNLGCNLGRRSSDTCTDLCASESTRSAPYNQQWMYYSSVIEHYSTTRSPNSVESYIGDLYWDNGVDAACILGCTEDRRLNPPGPPNPCVCQSSWTSSSDCEDVQFGCPSPACDGDDAWCVVSEVGCDQAGPGGTWAYCDADMVEPEEPSCSSEDCFDKCNDQYGTHWSTPDGPNDDKSARNGCLTACGFCCDCPQLLTGGNAYYPTLDFGDEDGHIEITDLILAWNVPALVRCVAVFSGATGAKAASQSMMHSNLTNFWAGTTPAMHWDQYGDDEDGPTYSIPHFTEGLGWQAVDIQVFQTGELPKLTMEMGHIDDNEMISVRCGARAIGTADLCPIIGFFLESD